MFSAVLTAVCFLLDAKCQWSRSCQRWASMLIFQLAVWSSNVSCLVAFTLCGHLISYTLLVLGPVLLSVIWGTGNMHTGHHTVCSFDGCVSTRQLSRSPSTQRLVTVWVQWTSVMWHLSVITLWVHCVHKGVDVVIHNTQAGHFKWVGTEGCVKKMAPPLLRHHNQPKPLIEVRMGPSCISMPTLPFKCGSRYWDLADQAMLFHLVLVFGQPMQIVVWVSCFWWARSLFFAAASRFDMLVWSLALR